jgi:hypothetical protein
VKKWLFSAMLLSIMFSSIQCFAQVKQEQDSTYLGLCWSSNLDTTARYLLYYKPYQSLDTNWYYIGSTKSKDYYVPKGNIKGKLIFGVKSVWYNDTSEMHMSLDTTACASGNVCGDSCTQGGWYANWHVQKPKKINIKK